jgi:hypothetical protein
LTEHLKVGQELQLYDGTRVHVRAMAIYETAELLEDAQKWILQLTARLREPAVDAGPSAEAPAITWASLFRVILATSNPELAIDAAWCREHLFFPDLVPILKAWAEENRLEPLLDDLKDRAAAAALDLVKALVSAVTATAAATQAVQAPPPAPGEASDG